MHAKRPCPDSALLAAFIEGQLPTYERTAVVSHLAECDQCRGVAVGVVGFQEVQSLDRMWDEPAETAPIFPVDDLIGHQPTLELSRTLAYVAVAAAVVGAGAISLTLLQSSWFEHRPVAALVDASTGVRSLEARVSGGFAHAVYTGTAPDVARSSGQYQLVSTATRVRDTFANETDSRSRTATGVAALLVGDLDAAVNDLALASATAPADGQLANDLAAALYERSQRADREDDLPRALNAVQHALSVAPQLTEAWFNRALITSALGLKSEARAAWAAYLERDSTSPWATEARQRAEALMAPRVPGDPWPVLRARLDASADAGAADMAVRFHASRVRAYFESDLIWAWIAASRSGQDELLILSKMRVVADAFMRLAGERLYVDTLQAIDHARTRGEGARAAAAHEALLQALPLMAAGQRQKAAPILKRAHAQLVALGDPLSARVEIELAAVDHYAGRLAAASAALRSLKPSVRQKHYAILQMRVSWLQGLVAYDQSDFVAAQTFYEERLDLATTASDIEQIVSSQVLLANLHGILGNAATAWRYRIDAAVSIDEVQSPIALAGMLLGAASEVAAHRLQHASLVFQAAMLSIEKPVPPPFVIQALALRARTFYELGREADAQRELDRARERLNTVTDATGHARLEPDVLAAESQVWRASDPQRALAAAERALTLPVVQRDPLRVARFQLALAEAAIGTADLARAEQAIKTGIEVFETVRDTPGADLTVGNSEPASFLYVKGIELALQRGNPARAFEYSERRRIRTSFERRQWGHQVLPLDHLQQAMTEDTAVAVLNQLGDQLQVWVIRRDVVHTQSVRISRGRAETLVASHLQEVSLGKESPTVSAELFDAVLAPVSPALRGIRNLVVVADAPYHHVAFSALWNRTTNRFLVEDHALVSAPSATAYAWAVTRGRMRTDDTRRAAVIIESPRASSAPMSDARQFRNRADLAALYRGAELLRGETATPARLFADVRQRDMIHVAAPLASNDEFPSTSRLLLAGSSTPQDGAVYAGQLAATGLARARLIALETTQRHHSPTFGDGAHGFIGALLVAGVPNIVGPVADVDPSTIEQTWLEFHRHYAGGQSAAASLRQAQLTALRASNHRPGPWALLTVFGSTQ